MVALLVSGHFETGSMPCFMPGRGALWRNSALWIPRDTPCCSEGGLLVESFHPTVKYPSYEPSKCADPTLFFFSSRVYQFGRRDYNPTALSTDPYNGMIIKIRWLSFLVLHGHKMELTRCNCQWVPAFSSFFLTGPADLPQQIRKIMENRYDLVSKQEAHFSMWDFPLPCLIPG